MGGEESPLSLFFRRFNMPSLIELIEEINESSVFGAAADTVYESIKNATSVQELLQINIDSPAVIIRSVRDTLARQSTRRAGELCRLISAIPSVAVQEDFI
jgi:hypothetical protein